VPEVSVGAAHAAGRAGRIDPGRHDQACLATVEVQPGTYNEALRVTTTT
jgi:hypothetical protein